MSETRFKARGKQGSFGVMKLLKKAGIYAAVFALVVQLVSVGFQRQANAIPYPVTGGFTDVATSDDHVCAVRSGAAFCWGVNAHGAFGNGTADDENVAAYMQAVNTSGVLAGKTVISIENGYQYSCALTSDHDVYCWGLNALGQLGNGSTQDSYVPVAIDMSGVLNGLTITSLTAGYQTACITASDGNAYCWGSNAYGQAGSGTVGGTYASPVQVAKSGVLADITLGGLSVSATSACGIGSDQQVYCWGRAGGDGSNPVKIDNSAHNVAMRAVSVASNNMCEVGVNAQVYCQGNNNLGQLGNGTTTPSPTPVAVDASSAMAGQAMQHVSIADDNTACAQAFSGRVFCWGRNDGQAGSGTGVLGVNSFTGSYSAVPIEVEGFASGAKAVSMMNSANKCALTEMGTIGCWGGTQGRGNGRTVYVDEQSTVTYVSLPGPFVSYIDVSSAYADTGNVLVTVYGNDFSAGMIVKFGTSQAVVQSWTPTSVTVEVPTSGYSAQTTVDVSVTNSEGFTGVLQQAFTVYVHNPYISGLSQMYVNLDGEEHDISVYGSDFEQGAVVKFDGQPFATTFISNYELQITVPTAGETPKNVEVSVTNPDGRTAMLYEAFVYQTTPVTGITGVTFEQYLGNRIIRVNGEHFSDFSVALYDPGYATLNGTQLPFCADGFGETAQELVDGYGVPAGHVSDAAPCFIVMDSTGIALTPTQVLIRIPDDFDAESSGTVSVSGVSYAFNQPAGDTGAGSNGTENEPGTGGGGAVAGNGAHSVKPASSGNVGLQRKNIQAATGSDSSGEETGMSTAAAIPTVLTNASALKNGSVIDSKPTFSGVAAPNSKVKVTVHSDPVTCSTTANEAGMWRCALSEELPKGPHEVTVAVAAPDGTERILGPYSVTVAGTDTKAVADGAITSEAQEQKSFWPVVAMIGGAIGIAAVVVIVLRARKNRSA